MIRWLLLSTHKYWYNNAPKNLRQVTKWFQNLNQTCSYKWNLMCDDSVQGVEYHFVWYGYLGCMILKILMNDRSVYFTTNVIMLCFDWSVCCTNWSISKIWLAYGIFVHLIKLFCALNYWSTCLIRYTV